MEPSMMRGIYAGAILSLAALTGPVEARTAIDFDRDIGDDSDSPQLPYLQCVPYARQVSGIQIYGDALTWWDQAKGHYARGHEPRVGAVMAFRPYGNMRLGHVAAVSEIIDSRTVLLRHANWSPIDGHRGQIEDNVRAIDVSPNNDWSEVRVWFAPIQALGSTHWPIAGFIYNEMPRLDEKADPVTIARTAQDRATTLAFSARTGRPTRQSASLTQANDPIGAIIARAGR
jgi:surface antigen